MENKLKLEIKISIPCLLTLSDKVNRYLLMEKMKRMGIKGRMLWALRNIYSQTKSLFRANNEYGEVFYNQNGLRKGCPILFNIYLIDL